MVMLVIVLYMLLASTFTLAKAALVYIDPLLFIAIRMIIAGFLLLGYLYCAQRSKFRYHSAHRFLFVQITLFHIYGSYVFEFLGLPHINSAKACLLYNLVPFVTVFFAYSLMAERMTRIKWLGLIIGFLGFFPLLLGSAQAGEGHSSWLRISWPELMILLSVVCAARGWVVMQKLVKHEGYSPIMVNGFGMLTGGILAALSSIIIEGWPHLHAFQAQGAYPLDALLYSYLGSTGAIVVFYTIALLLIANIICYNLYGYLLQHYSATFISFVGILTPLFAAIYGRVLLNETLPNSFLLSISIISVGLYLFYRQELNVRKG